MMTIIHNNTIPNEIWDKVKHLKQIRVQISLSFQKPNGLKREEQELLDLVDRLEGIVYGIYRTPDRGNNRMELAKTLSKEIVQIYGKQPQGTPWAFILDRLQRLSDGRSDGPQKSITQLSVLASEEAQVEAMVTTPIAQENANSSSASKPLSITISDNVQVSESVPPDADISIAPPIAPTRVIPASPQKPLAVSDSGSAQTLEVIALPNISDESAPPMSSVSSIEVLPAASLESPITPTEAPSIQKSPAPPSPDGVHAVEASASRSTPGNAITGLAPDAAPAEVVPAVSYEPLVAPTCEQAPHGEPAITVYLKTTINYFDILKNQIDNAPPINGQAHERFSYSLDDLNNERDCAVDSVCGNAEFESLGLNVNKTDQGLSISGIPRHGFEGQLYFVFIRQGTDGSRRHQKPMSIIDPRLMWQDQDVQDDEGYPAKKTDHEAHDLPVLGKTAVAASCRGRSHAHVGKPRDDYFSMDFDENSGWHFVTVADGAGSAKYSRKGAELACKVVIQELHNLLAEPTLMERLKQDEDKLKQWKGLFDTLMVSAEAKTEEEQSIRSQFDYLDNRMYIAVHAAYMAIYKEAQTKGLQVRDYHTTLLCAAFRKFSFGYFFITYWVGDGGLALLNWNHQNRVIVPGVPDGGEFAGQTRFLTMKEEIEGNPIKKRTRYSFADDFEALILMTDGVADPFFPAERDVTTPEKWLNFWNKSLQDGFDDNPGCRELFNEGTDPEEKSAALLKWLNFWSKGNHDDRTILIIK